MSKDFPIGFMVALVIGTGLFVLATPQAGPEAFLLGIVSGGCAVLAGMYDARRSRG